MEKNLIKFAPSNLVVPSAEALAFAPTKLYLLKFGDNLEALIRLGPISLHDLLKKLLRARMRANKRPLEHIKVDSFVFNLARNKTQTEVNHVLHKENQESY